MPKSEMSETLPCNLEEIEGSEQEQEQELLLDTQSIKSNDSFVGKMVKYVWSFFQSNQEDEGGRENRRNEEEEDDISVTGRFSKYVWSFIPKYGESDTRSLRSIPTDFMAAAAELNCRMIGVEKVPFAKEVSTVSTTNQA